MSEIHIRYKKQTPKQRHWTIHLISIWKIVKGILAVFIGIKLLTLLDRDVSLWFADFLARHNIDAENRYVHAVAEKLVGMTNNKLILFSIASFLYAALDFVEGIGLWLEKRWAEWLTAVATSLFVPIELYEIYERFTWIRVLILVINLFVIWYLITRLRDEEREELATERTENTEENQ